MKNGILFIFCVFLLGTHITNAQNSANEYFSKGYTAWDRGDYAEARKYYERAADLGDEKAMYNLGMMYANGEGGYQNDDKAKYWFRKSADKGAQRAKDKLLEYEVKEGNFTNVVKVWEANAAKGDTMAMSNLGMAYFLGKGYRQDYVEARKWFERAASRGNNQAMGRLGLMYLNGLGVAKDTAMAVQWFKKSADIENAADDKLHSNGDALYLLGLLAESGYELGGFYDYYDYFSYASRKGNVMAMYRYAMLIYNETIYKKEPKKLAFEWMQKSAKGGVVPAMRMLADMYYEGYAGSPSYSSAAKWYLKLGEMDSLTNWKSMVRLGMTYVTGGSVEKDNSEAEHWFGKAVLLGKGPAAMDVGTSLLKGKGGNANPKEAEKWFETVVGKVGTTTMLEIAALYKNEESNELKERAEVWLNRVVERGGAQSMYDISDMYFTGKYGMKQNNEEALKWLNKAADNGNVEALTKLSNAYEYELFGLKKDKTKIISLTRKAADKGDGYAMYVLGTYYLEGNFIEKNESEARKWFQKAADKGNRSAMGTLGLNYLNGDGVPKDYAKAAVWLKKAAVKGDYRSMSAIGMMYYKGQGVAKNYAEAAKWLQQLLEKKSNDSRANGILGVMYYYGHGVTKDYEKARKLLLDGDRKDVLILSTLGLLYYSGNGVAKNVGEAKSWFQMAADLGDKKSIEWLKERGYM